MTVPNDDEWCREESCRHRHWRSGSMPTHKRGADCPPPMTAPSPAGLSPLLDQLDEARIPNHPETRRGFADLPVTRETVHAAIYHAMPYENHESTDRFAELAEAAGDEAWLFVRDLLDTQQQLTAAIRAVLDKHRPIGGPSHFDGDESDYCDDDGFIWPCSTYRALTAALTPGADTADNTREKD